MTCALGNRRGAALLEALLSLALLVGGLAVVIGASRTLTLASGQAQERQRAHWVLESLRSDVQTGRFEPGFHVGEEAGLRWTVAVERAALDWDEAPATLFEASLRVEWSTRGARHTLTGSELHVVAPR